MNNEVQQLYKSRLKDLLNNHDMIKLYAKSSCRHCYGRGYITKIDRRTKDKVTGQFTNFNERNEICDCVYKKMKKEIEESLKDG